MLRTICLTQMSRGLLARPLIRQQSSPSAKPEKHIENALVEHQGLTQTHSNRILFKVKFQLIRLHCLWATCIKLCEAPLFIIIIITATTFFFE